MPESPQKLSLEDLRFLLFETTPEEDAAVRALSGDPYEVDGWQITTGADCASCNCTNCTNCTGCSNCTNCTKCSNCTACTACTTCPPPCGNWSECGNCTWCTVNTSPVGFGL